MAGILWGHAGRFWKAGAEVRSGSGSGAGPTLSQTGKTLSKHIPWFFYVFKAVKNTEGAFRQHHRKVATGASESKNALFLSRLAMAFGDRPKQAKDYSLVVKDVLLAGTIHLSSDHLSAFSLLLSPGLFFLVHAVACKHLVLEGGDSAKEGPRSRLPGLRVAVCSQVV